VIAGEDTPWLRFLVFEARVCPAVFSARRTAFRAKMEGARILRAYFGHEKKTFSPQSTQRTQRETERVGKLLFHALLGFDFI
jgi:hypothetical protein